MILFVAAAAAAVAAALRLCVCLFGGYFCLFVCVFGFCLFVCLVVLLVLFLQNNLIQGFAICGADVLIALLPVSLTHLPRLLLSLSSSASMWTWDGSHWALYC